MIWTDESVALARNLWDEGLPASEIARRLGCSKNSLVGKAHRLKFPARPSPIVRNGENAQRRIVVKQSREAIAKIVVVREKPKPAIASPSRRCLWTDGHPGAFVCCNAMAVRQCFCAEHAERGLSGKKWSAAA